MKLKIFNFLSWKTFRWTHFNCRRWFDLNSGGQQERNSVGDSGVTLWCIQTVSKFRGKILYDNNFSLSFHLNQWKIFFENVFLPSSETLWTNFAFLLCLRRTSLFFPIFFFFFHLHNWYKSDVFIYFIFRKIGNVFLSSWRIEFLFYIYIWYDVLFLMLSI